MRRHKAVARIFLFLSIVNFTFASLAQTPIPTMHEARIDLVTGAEGMAEVSEMAHTQSGELPELLGRPSTAGHLQSRLDIAPAPSFSDASLAADAEKNKFFNKELNRRMKEYLVLGTIAGLFTGLANGMQKEIMGSVSPNAYVFMFLYKYLSSLSPPANTLNGMSHKTYSD